MITLFIDKVTTTVKLFNVSAMSMTNIKCQIVCNDLFVIMISVMICYH